MTTLVNQSDVTLPNGTTNIPQVALPANSTKMVLTLARCTTATPNVWQRSDQTIHVDLQFSYDNGVSWEAANAFDSSGGIASFHGKEVTNSTGTWIYASNPTHLRGTVVASNGPIRTSVFVDIV